MKKRVLSSTMAGVLALSLAVPAFASGQETVVEGTYQAVDIAVTVPETGKAFINPYGLDIEVPEDAADSGNSNKATISGQQIVSAPMAIKNESKMDLKIGATVTGTIKTGSTMTFATASTKGTPELPDSDPNYVAPSTSKNAFVYLQAKATTAADTDLVDTSANVTAAKVATAFAAWEPEAYDAATDVIVGTREAKTENLVTLRAATVDASNTVTYNPGSIALFRLSGDCPASPRTAWADADGFTANIAFSFSVANIKKYTVTKGTIQDTSGSDLSGSVTYTGPAVVPAEGDTVVVKYAGFQSGEYVTVTLKDADGTVLAAGDGASITGASGADAVVTFKMPAKNVTIDVKVNTAGNAFATPAP